MTPVAHDHLRILFDSTIDIALGYRKNQCGKEPIATTELQQVVSMCNLLEYFFELDKGFKGSDDDKKNMVEAIFAWCLAWGLGSSLTS